MVGWIYVVLQFILCTDSSSYGLKRNQHTHIHIKFVCQGVITDRRASDGSHPHLHHQLHEQVEFDSCWLIQKQNIEPC